MAPMYMSVEGTGVADPYGPGFSGDVGRGLTDPWNNVWATFWGPQYANKWFWQPIGNYPAAVIPMEDSWMQAVVELTRQALLHEADGSCPVGDPLAAGGYSQGAIAVTYWLAHHVLDPNGPCHHRLADVQRGGIILFGDPTRCAGIANGNVVAGQPLPKELDGKPTGGISGEDESLTAAQTADYVLSCALDGDLYAGCSRGAAGKVEKRIYDFVQKPGFGSFLKIGLAIVHPIGICKAIGRAAKFFGAGVNAPHWKYDPFVPAMVDWLNSRV